MSQATAHLESAQSTLAGAQQQLPPLQKALEKEHKRVRPGSWKRWQPIAWDAGKWSTYRHGQSPGLMVSSSRLESGGPVLPHPAHACSTTDPLACSRLAPRQILKYSGEKMSLTKIFTTKKHQAAKLGALLVVGYTCDPHPAQLVQ